MSGLRADEIDEEKVLATVRDHFKPEFLNRVDEIIVFHRLLGLAPSFQVHDIGELAASAEP